MGRLINKIDLQNQKTLPDFKLALLKPKFWYHPYGTSLIVSLHILFFPLSETRHFAAPLAIKGLNRAPDFKAPSRSPHSNNVE